MIIDVNVKYELFGFQFIWSRKKSIAVRKKHQLAFEDVAGVFVDANAIEVPSGDVEGANLALIGHCAATGIIFVAYAYRNGDHLIRLISARKADASERALYQNNVLKNLGIHTTERP